MATSASPHAMRAHAARGCGFAFVFAAALFSLSPPAVAQSKDAKHPASLRAGVNAANVDSQTGDHYYYFYAGPGRIDVTMAFKSMGVFGAGVRQYLDIDFWDDVPKLTSHSRIVSAGKEERIHFQKDYGQRERVRIAVSPQRAPIVTGGRYEIQIAGAASFDAKDRADPSRVPAPSDGALLTQGSTPLVQNRGPLLRDSGAARDASAGGGALVTPGSTSLVQNSGPLVKPGSTSLVQNPGPLVQNSGPLVKPGSTSLVQNPGSLVRPVEVHETEHEIRVSMAAAVLVDFEKATLSTDAVDALRGAADVIRTSARGVVRVEGHTDSKGTHPYNLGLSRRRALAVRDWLVDTGLPVGEFRIDAYGETRPVAPNRRPDGRDDPEGRQRNRRVELLILK